MSPGFHDQIFIATFRFCAMETQLVALWLTAYFCDRTQVWGSALYDVTQGTDTALTHIQVGDNITDPGVGGCVVSQRL